MNNELKIFDISVQIDSEGRYCLNDLHRAAGGEKRHQPSNWLRTKQTQELIAWLDNYDSKIRKAKIKPTSIIRGNAKEQGTYVIKELVYDYAMWINSEFKLKVILI